MNRKNLIIIISILAFILLIGGVSYSYFVYNKDIGTVSLTAGDISIDLSGINGNQTLSNVIPLSDFDGKNSSNYFDFTVNSTVDTERIYYEVYILPDSNNTLDTSYLKTYLTDQSNNEIKGTIIFNDLGNSEVENGKVIYKGLIEVNQNGTTRTETKDFRLRLWIDESYNEQASKTFAFDIYLYAKNVDDNFVLPYGANLLRNAILAKEAQGGSCSKISWTDTEDNITYLSGTNDCIDMNYVWYSGKLWRITSIYSDGAMKMITEENETIISYNGIDQNYFYNSENDKSYAYQWLNEDFYDVLYNPSFVIDGTKEWNASPTSPFTMKPTNTSLVSTNVGLINSYEYYNSFRCINSGSCEGTNSSDSYLNIDEYFWILNPYSNLAHWRINNEGNYSGNYVTVAYGIRPAIIINPGLEFTGNGTINNPYKIIGDKKVAKANDKINTRLSGEYIKLKNGSNEQLFRIIDIEDSKTKIVSMDFANNSSTKTFASDNSGIIWGSGTTASSNTWYTYLTSTYYPNLVTTYGNLFDSGTYYMGQISDTGSYKLGVCTSASSTIKNCEKTSSKGVFIVGIPRIGEIHATSHSITAPIEAWSINSRTSSSMWYLGTFGYTYYDESNTLHGVRPTLHLKSTIKILSGSGTQNDPYVVGL